MQALTDILNPQKVTMTISIRPYHKRDEQALLNIIQKNVPEFFAAHEVQELQAYLQGHIDQYFVIEDHQTIIGAGGINRYPEEQLASISWDYIDPTYQKKGIGSLLLTHRLTILLNDSSIKRIRVRTSQKAYQFYQRFGFVTHHTQTDFWGEGLDLYEMFYQP